MTRNSLRQQGISSPFPFSPKGKPGRGRFPPRRSTLRANKKRWHASMPPAPPTRGAAAPLWIPCERGGAELGPVRTNRMFGRRKSAENRPTLENRLHRKLVTTPEQLQKKNKEKPPRRLDLTVPSHGRDECPDRGSLPRKENL
jgi:hypothetical protein